MTPKPMEQTPTPRTDALDASIPVLEVPQSYSQMRDHACMLERELSEFVDIDMVLTEIGHQVGAREGEPVIEAVFRYVARMKASEERDSEQVSDALDPSVGVPWMRCSPDLPKYVANLEGIAKANIARAEQAEMSRAASEERVAQWKSNAVEAANRAELAEARCEGLANEAEEHLLRANQEQGKRLAAEALVAQLEERLDAMTRAFNAEEQESYKQAKRAECAAKMQAARKP